MSCKDKTIILGVSGGIACYKSVELVRLLVKEGAHVHVVMTSHAQKFVTPLTFQTLSGNPVAADLFSLTERSEITHIQYAHESHAIVVAPATANIIGKMAHGIADDLLTTITLAASVPIVLAPAMNMYMWNNPILQENLKKLGGVGVTIIEPGEGYFASMHEGMGKGRMAEPEDILGRVVALFHDQDLKGETILITAGPTQEPLDPVRFISNRSSGRMGAALARAAIERGGKVTVIAGPLTVDLPNSADVVRVKTTEEMRKAVLHHYPLSTIIIMAAAVCDYRPAAARPSKIKRNGKALTLTLEQTPDILGELGRKKDSRFLVGFAAETSSIATHARSKLRDKNLDLIVANDVRSPRWGFDSENNKVTIISRNGKTISLPSLKKIDVAHKILDIIHRQKTR